ncbi:hypothetical protein [Lysobacter gummosus]
MGARPSGQREFKRPSTQPDRIQRPGPACRPLSIRRSDPDGEVDLQ